MKQKTAIIIAASAALLCSCSIDESNRTAYVQEKECVLTFALDIGEGSRTKALAPYAESQDYEKFVRNVQILIFDKDGKLNGYKNAGTATSGIEVGTTSGQKTVWAAVNAPDLSATGSVDELMDIVADLSWNSKSDGFIMAGNKTCSVPGNSSLSIPVHRTMSRIALTSVTNNLPAAYGDIKLDNIFLANVVGTYGLNGPADTQTWYNKMGRREDASSSSHIIDGSTSQASCQELTFIGTGLTIKKGSSHTPSTPYLFYCYPNGETSDNMGWSSPFTPRKTRIVAAATIAGTKYYYPITIDSPESNKSYTVSLTISGLGSSDPDIPVSKGTISFSVEIEDWGEGACYDEVI